MKFELNYKIVKYSIKAASLGVLCPLLGIHCPLLGITGSVNIWL